MIEDIQFYNMGFLDIRIPNNLFESLKNECYTTGYENKQITSDLTGNGVATQRYIENEDNIQKLQDFLQSLIPTYRQKFDIDPSNSKSNNFIMNKPWINYQKKYEFIPKHLHTGVFSYTIWINIPYNSEDEIKNGSEYASSFEFHYSDIIGGSRKMVIKLNKSDAGRMLFFPSLLSHQVYPFYTSDEVRISISGNLSVDVSNLGEKND